MNSTEINDKYLPVALFSGLQILPGFDNAFQGIMSLGGLFLDTEQKYNESGLCLCGCGQKTEITVDSCKKRGLEKGKPHWFIHGHHNKGIKNNRWNGGKSTNNGYVLIKSYNHPKSDKRNYVFEHILYAERVLGKYLSEKAVIHHINGDKTQQEKNLVICQDQAYHVLLHKRQRAFRTCGHANWLRCPFCHKYDDPVNLQVNINLSNVMVSHHKKCINNDKNQRYSKEKRRKYYLETSK